MNIAIGKFARSINFDRSKWGIIGGDEMPYVFYFEMARRYPEHDFWLIGRNSLADYRKKIAPKATTAFAWGAEPVEEEPIDVIPSNLHSIWEDYAHLDPKNYKYKDLPDHWKTWVKDDLGKADPDKDSPHIVNYLNWETHMLPEILKNHKFDLGIFIYGPISNIHIPHVSRVSDKGSKSEYTRWNVPLAMLSNYAAPMIKLCNEMGFPHIAINEDPRYLGNTFLKDLVNIEKCVLTQINKNQLRHYLDMENPKSKLKDCKKTHVKHIYAKPETIFLMNEEKIDFREMEKPNKFVMTINGGWERFNIIKKWIFLHDDEVVINGKWSDDHISDKKYKDRFIMRPIAEMEDDMWKTRYTLIAPMDNNKFVTQKFWKMIYYGIIPFLHPDYDNDNLFDVPEVLRPENPEAMWKTINYLDNNPEVYAKMLQLLYDKLEDGLFNGDTFFGILNDNLNEHVGFSL